MIITRDVSLDLDLLLNICGCASVKSGFSLIPMGCVFVGECMWSSLKPPCTPPLSSPWQLIYIWARQSGWAAVLLVIASEMNYLAASETEGGEEFVIELPPPSLSLTPQVITSAVQKAICCPHISTQSQNNAHALTKPTVPLPPYSDSSRGPYWCRVIS